MVDQIPDPAPKLRSRRALTRCECSADHRQAILDRSIVTDEGCWTWTGGLDRDGYGRFRHDGRSWKAHRLSYFAYRGQIPDGLVMDHLCRNRACVNPEHLEPVTDRVNILRGEGFAAHHYRKETCVRGHVMPERDENGRRRCSECYANAYQIAKERNQTIHIPEEWHGTTNGYTNYQCRCEPCQAAGAERNRQGKAGRLRRGLADDDPRHGTYNGYTNWKCRCEPCKAAARRYYESKRRAA